VHEDSRSRGVLRLHSYEQTVVEWMLNGDFRFEKVGDLAMVCRKL
jgi:hypothetical protein